MFGAHHFQCSSHILSMNSHSMGNPMIAKLSPVSLEPGSRPQHMLPVVGKQAGPIGGPGIHLPGSR